MIKENDKVKLENLKEHITSEDIDKAEERLKNYNKKKRMQQELVEAETVDDMKEYELIAKVLEEEKKIKPKKTSNSKVSTEDIIKAILDEHYIRMVQLLKDVESNICFRTYNSVKAEVRRQLGGSNIGKV